MAEDETRVMFLDRNWKELYPEISKPSLTNILKRTATDPDSSAQDDSEGEKPHIIDIQQAILLKEYNPYHSTCIETKTSATTGLGFVKDSTEELLDPLTQVSCQDLLTDVTEDFHQTGNGYMEVIREDRRTNNSPITGLHHIPASTIHAVVEDNDAKDTHYIIRPQSAREIRFARFGDLEDFLSRRQRHQQAEASEVIHFRKPTSRSKHYGLCNWIGAVPSIELAQCIHQYGFDFFLNRGVPEFLLFVKGSKIDKKTWDEIQQTMKANIGYGNSHKSAAFNFPNDNVEVIVERLAMESTSSSDTISKLTDTLALEIVSGHQVPPLLAGIQIPGKLGASNELPNAIMAFQLLVIGQSQKIFTSQLGVTLGDKSLNSGLSLGRKDFKFKTILKEMAENMEALSGLDTMGRMKETLPEAKAKGRDVNQGVLK
jgi:hypothetical protein